MRLVALAQHHASALLDFERQQRDWFEQSVEARNDHFYCAAGIDAHLADYVAQRAAGKWHAYVLLNAQEELIGRANLRNILAGCGEIGYRIGRQHSGKGIASEAVVGLVKRAREMRALRQLVAFVTVHNPVSVRVLEKSGFVRGEFLPAHASLKAGVVDAIVYRLML